MSEELLGIAEVGVPTRSEVGIGVALSRLMPLTPKPRGLSRHRNVRNEDQLTVPEHHLNLSPRLIQTERPTCLRRDGHRAIALLHRHKTQMLFHESRIPGIQGLVQNDPCHVPAFWMQTASKGAWFTA
ncbi:MAG: hypothetical protein M3Y73_07040, partial [Actinomycetota bacterium]|nr:hypothetical protein [Actinomycetota bacterium]